MQLVSIITATTGRRELRRCIESVQRQSYPAIQHLVVVDGEAHRVRAEQILADYPDVDVIYLPYSTRSWGGRIYAAMPQITRGDYIMNLDDDNFLEPDHVQSLVDAIGDNAWAYCLRNITLDGMFIARDDSDSLGFLNPTVRLRDAPKAFSEYHVDTGCYLLRRDVSLEFSWRWCPTNFGEQVYWNDRFFLAALIKQYPSAPCTLRYTLNYEILPSVIPYVLEKNALVARDYPNGLPWAGDSLRASMHPTSPVNTHETNRPSPGEYVDEQLAEVLANADQTTVKLFIRRGIWSVDEARDGHYVDEPLADAIIREFPLAPETVADLGCGLGQYCRHFTQRAGWNVQGYEGMPEAKEMGIYERIQQVDLSQRQTALPDYDLVISLEVGEHIPKQFEANYLDNVTSIAKKSLILSWAIPGRGGTGHFNEHENPYIISQIERRGFRFNPERTARLRMASTLWWFEATLLAFERVT